MMEDRNGSLWIATHGLGLLKLVREQSKFIRYVNVPSDPESLPQDKLDAVFADREGNIWAAFGRLAPAFLAPQPAPFEKLPKVPGATIEPFIGALYEDHDGVLWTGTPEALIRRDQNTGQTTAYRTGGPAVYTDVVSICEDHSGSLWLGTYGHGLHRFDRRTGTFKTYRHNPADSQSLSNNIVMRCLIDHNGTLWAGTADGLDRFDAATERFTTYKLESQSLFILELIEDRQGMIWVGTDASGLRRFDRATGQITVYKHSTNVPSTLSDNRVNSVHFDHSGTMWVGTQNGLDRLDPQTGGFSAFTPRDGLPGNAVGCILEDKNGNLWMSTNNGVARFSPQSKAFTSFSTAEGLPGPNLTGWGACFQSPSGRMFFGGYNGGTSFFPERVADSSHAPPVVLTDFRLFGNPVQIGADSPLRRSISYSSELTLGSQQNIFSIGFAGLGYASPATNRYRYKLEGLEHKWNEVGSDRRQATYTTLPPGTYTFRAQAATSRGPWSEPGVTLRIAILPPWWSTKTFQALYISALLIFIWSLYRYRIGQLRYRYQLRLEERVGERTRLARELHDTLLQSFHGLMLHFQVVTKLLPEGKAKEQLEKAMERADRAIAEGRSAVYDLRSSTRTTNDLAEAVNTVGNELSNDHDAAFNLTAEGPTRDLHPIIRDEIYRISREALSNAFKHAHARHIEAEISYGPRAFRLRIRDDGNGIPAEVLEQGRAGHFGLPGLRERAKQIGAELTIWSRPGTGTEIDLSLAGTIAYGTSPRRSRFGLFKQKVVEK
jgi:signal transduction histidine kinase/streptogramin lyase